MLKHMVGRSNAWRFEILNSSHKTWGSFKFLLRKNRAGTSPEHRRAHSSFLNSSFHHVSPAEVPVPNRPQAVRHKAAIHHRSPLHICMQSHSLPRLNKESMHYSACKGQTAPPAWDAAECTKRAGKTSVQSVPGPGAFTNSAGSSQGAYRVSRQHRPFSVTSCTAIQSTKHSRSLTLRGWTEPWAHPTTF